MSDRPTTPPPRIPGLELGDVIGEGGMSVVYRAVHTALRRTVAVKVLHPAAGDGPDAGRESWLTAALAHPHVVDIHDAGRADGRRYLVLEELTGGSLRSRMTAGRPWPPDRAAAVVDQLARALEYVHGRGVLHLDLKPENVLFAADGTAKVTDFGLATRPADATALREGRPLHGTLDYSSPEQRTGLPLDARSDVFSLATLAYELLTGRLPGRVYVPPSARTPGLPPALDDVLRRGLAREPDDRTRTAAEFRQEFIAAAGTPRPRRAAWWPAAAVAVGVLAAVLAVTLNRGTPSSAPPAPPAADRPTRLWLLYDRPDDLDLFPDLDRTAPAVERVRLGEQVPGLPPDLPVPFAPRPRPLLVIRSAGAWGFVHPLADRTLARRVAADWPAVLRATVPDAANFVTAGRFDGDCLDVNRAGGRPWRLGGGADGKLAVHVPPAQPENPVLVLHQMAPVPGKKQIGCYQTLATAPGPGTVALLRFRARVGQGSPNLAVYGSTKVELSETNREVAAERVRRTAEPDASAKDRWLFRTPGWVTPTADWQTFVTVTEFPPPPARVIPHQVVIDVTLGQAWVDDVDWFGWTPKSDPP